MKRNIHKLYKGIEFILSLLQNNLYTLIFKIKLNLNNISYGKNLHIYGSIPLLSISYRSSNVYIGNNIKINSYAGHSWFCHSKIIVRKNAKLTINDNTGINGVLIYCENEITIGKYVNIGGGSRIFDTNHHNLDWEKRRNPQYNCIATTAPIHIEDDVFIGANCIINKGVTIGARSIIAAGSVVIKNIPSDEIWGGNPARFIKKVINS